MLYTAYSDKCNCKFIYIHFDFRIGNNSKILDDFNLAGVIPSEVVRKEAAIFSEACTKFEKSSSMSSISLKGSFTLLLASILSYYSDEYHLIDNYKCNSFTCVRLNSIKRKDIAKLTILQPVFQYAANNIHKQIKIDDLSASVNMSEKYFISYFKSALGITPGNYITQLKIPEEILNKGNCKPFRLL